MTIVLRGALLLLLLLLLLFRATDRIRNCSGSAGSLIGSKNVVQFDNCKGEVWTVVKEQIWQYVDSTKEVKIWGTYEQSEEATYIDRACEEQRSNLKGDLRATFNLRIAVLGFDS